MIKCGAGDSEIAQLTSMLPDTIEVCAPSRWHSFDVDRLGKDAAFNDRVSLLAADDATQAIQMRDGFG